MLHAGGNWNNGTNCRSQSRNANNYRWNTNSNIGLRRQSDTGFRVNSWLDPSTLSASIGPAKHITEDGGG